MTDLPENLGRGCLYNWLGYGNPNATYWFIGVEESLYRWEGFDNVADVRGFLENRREFDVTEDFRDVWEKKHGFDLEAWSEISTWLFQGVFLLAAEDDSIVTTSDLSERAWKFVFGEKKLGRKGGQSLTGEMFPLPKARDEIEPYDHIWESEAAYKQEVLPNRVRLLTETLEANRGVDWIISYGITDSNPCAKELRLQYPADTVDSWSGSGPGHPYTLYRLHLPENRTVNLLHTPFFGMGQTSYEEVANAARYFHDFE